MKLTDLVAQISEIDAAARLSAGRTLQQILSLRNWLIGAHIIEFEQAGEDRAAYGQRLMSTLARALREAGCEGLSPSNLKNFRQVTLAYPGLDAAGLGRRLAFPGLRSPHPPPADPSSPRHARRPDDPALGIRQTSGEFVAAPGTRLQRQRDSMLYERIGLSENRDAVLALTREGALDASSAAQLRDPYVFEFLGIERRAVTNESDLERALVDHLQDFLFEMGRDFCFVARQFRITAGNRHHYIDLLLFHRRLRCLVAIDLKLGAFEPEHAGQLRFYVNYLAEHVAYPEENPPVGILLCAERDAEVVRFATAGDGDLFVTRYQLALPSEEQLKRWLHEERARIEQVSDDTEAPR